MYDPLLCWRAFLVVVTAVLIVLSVLVVKVMAHESGAMNYDIECCSSMDCAPVDKVEIVPSQHAMASMFASPAIAAPLSNMVVTTKHGTVVVPANFKHRESKDGRMHACLRPMGGGVMRLICLYMPPSM